MQIFQISLYYVVLPLESRIGSRGVAGLAAVLPLKATFLSESTLFFFPFWGFFHITAMALLSIMMKSVNCHLSPFPVRVASRTMQAGIILSAQNLLWQSGWQAADTSKLIC